MLQPRPPIITIMGHVDHGKTSLLDAIRKTDIAAREHGGITQHIGAYQVEFETDGGKNKVSFLDTPGHAAFAKMRARGANATDIVILVVAANDGVMPQTKESIEHIKSAGVPFLVAITKSDLSEADPNKVKSQLAENGVFVEGCGGDVVALPVSSKTGQGIKELLELLVLIGQMQNLQADADASLEAVVVESRSDSGRGPTATVLIKNGSLKVGQTVFIDNIESRVRALFDEKAKPVPIATPGTPVEVLGLTSVPAVGAPVSTSNSPVSQNQLVSSQSALPVEGIENKLKVILKADVAGSLEAVVGLINSGDVAVLSSGVGEIIDSDILLAKTTRSLVYGFNVKISSSVEKLAEGEQVKVKTFRIIYELIEDLEKRIGIMKNPNLGEKVLGKASIIAEFKIENDRIAGCKVTQGRIAKGDTLHLVRGEEVLGNVKIKSLKHQKGEIQEAKVNQEFGAILSPYIDFKISDVLVSFEPAEEL